MEDEVLSSTSSSFEMWAFISAPETDNIVIPQCLGSMRTHMVSTANLKSTVMPQILSNHWAIRLNTAADTIKSTGHMGYRAEQGGLF